MGLWDSISSILSPIGEAITAPLKWTGDIVEKAGDITGIDPIKYLGRGVHDFTTNKTVQNIAPIIAATLAAPYVAPSLFAAEGAGAGVAAASPYETALATIGADTAIPGATATASGITGAAPLASMVPSASAELGAGLTGTTGGGLGASLTEGGLMTSPGMLSPGYIPTGSTFGTAGSNLGLGAGIAGGAGAGLAAPSIEAGGEIGVSSPSLNGAPIWEQAAGVNTQGVNMDGGSYWDYITGAYDKAGDLVSAYPKTSAFAGLQAANLLSSSLQSNMMQGANEAQSKSYSDYLDALNPPEAVKNTQFANLAENARTQSNIAKKRVADTLAARGITGKGMAAPTGDLAQAEKDAINAAYNKIFGTYNVPSTPGPVNYAPSTGQLAGSNLAQMTAQGIPLALLMSKYGVS